MLLCLVVLALKLLPTYGSKRFLSVCGVRKPSECFALITHPLRESVGRESVVIPCLSTFDADHTKFPPHFNLLSTIAIY